MNVLTFIDIMCHATTAETRVDGSRSSDFFCTGCGGGRSLRNFPTSDRGACSCGISPSAHAGPTPVTATLSAPTLEVPDGYDLDFNSDSSPNVALGSALGPDGLPVATGPFGVDDMDPAIESPGRPDFKFERSQTGAGTIILPYAQYVPTGRHRFERRILFRDHVFGREFHPIRPGTVPFALGSDDNSFSMSTAS